MPVQQSVYNPCLCFYRTLAIFTHSCLVDLTDLTLAFKDSNSKLFDIVHVADVDAEKRVDNSLDDIGSRKAKYNVG